MVRLPLEAAVRVECLGVHENGICRAVHLHVSELVGEDEARRRLIQILREINDMISFVVLIESVEVD